jgi:hypothetical protein
MSAGRICTREVDLIEAGESVQAAAQRMNDRNVGTLLVVDDVLALFAEEFGQIGGLLRKEGPRGLAER